MLRTDVLHLTFPPSEQRKTILYLTRSPAASEADGSSNGGGRIGRAVHNEAELLDRIRDLLKERGRGEELVVFKALDYASLESFTKLVALSSAILGPRGGAM